MEGDNNSEACHTVYFVRHGESLGNVKRMLLPIAEDQLTDAGKLQAELLGKHLSDVRFTRAVSSDWPRAFGTAEIVLSHSKNSSGLKLVPDTTLVERKYGTYEGRSYQEALADIVRLDVSPLEWEPEGSETVLDFIARSDTFFEELCRTLDKSPNPETILVVSHGTFLMTFLTQVINKAPGKYEVFGWDPEQGTKLIGNANYFALAAERNPASDCKRKVHFNVVRGKEHLNELKKVEADALTRFTRDGQSPQASKFSSCVQQ